MGLWNNPNTYGMLMATGVVLTAGLLAASSKSKVQSLKLAESAEENTVTDSSPDPSSPKTHLNRPLDTFSPSAAEKGNLLRSLRSFVAIKSAILLVAAGMMAVGLFFSYSRGAWLGTAVGLLYLAKVYGKFKWRYVVLGAGLVALGALLIWGRTPDDAPWYLKRMDLSRPSAQHRIAAWSGAVQMMRDHPLGVGWNKAAEIYGKNYSPPEGSAAAITTNDYLMLGTQLGFPGLLCFVSYVALRLKSPKSKVQGPKSVEKSEIGNRKSEIANRQDACATLDIGRWTLDARLRIACRSAAIAMLVAFWFDGGLFKLATAAVFWILLELGNSNAEGRMKNAEIDQSLVTSAATKTNAGFTLVELLVVIAIIGILAALLMPVLSRAKLKGQQATCLNNLKQLQVCWQIYADDNQDTLARNIPGDPKSWINGQTGNMNAAASATNVSSLSSGLLFPYNKSYGIYKCPSARGPTKNTQDPSARSSGLDGSLLVRTCSITARLGNTTDHDCLVDSFIDPSQGVILKLSGIKNPGPANASVFIDESVTTVDDGFFAMGNYNPVSEPPPQDSGIVPAPRVSNPDPRSYQNSPSIRHGGSSMTLSFADGHVGLFRFTEGETEPFLENGQASVPDSQKQDWINFYSTIYPYP
jgi:prepilin-type N-terminal cleavage/methylation domain-containing protein/prepilin-type processing-associated H-X9-DG protein